MECFISAPYSIFRGAEFFIPDRVGVAAAKAGPRIDGHFDTAERRAGRTQPQVIGLVVAVEVALSHLCRLPVDAWRAGVAQAGTGKR